MTVGWETLDVGEQALVYNHEGSARIEDGPQRIFLWREKLVRLQRYTANQNSYLVIKYKDGRVEHKKGPCFMFKNPIAHISITVEPMIPLDANEALVVYRQDEETKEVQRYVNFGPTLFMPQSNEWLHQFSWHGTDPDNKAAMKVGASKFEKLQIIPGQFYYNVDEVRTADDTPIKVKLMLFFELKNIELMLNATKDPMADFINCMSSDVVAFASKYTLSRSTPVTLQDEHFMEDEDIRYIEFMEKSSDLNDAKNYPQLMERSKNIGYEVTKVVYRGYHAHDKLQKLHDNSIQTRTNLKIAYEREQQEQDLTDMKMKTEKDRTQLEQRLEIESLLHKQDMEKSQVEHRLAMELRDEEQKRERFSKDKAAELLGAQQVNNQKQDHLMGLSDLGVDLNQYLNVQSRRPDKIVQIVSSKNATNFHLHHS